MSHLQVTSHHFSETEKKKIVEAIRGGSVNKIIDTVLGARDAYLREHQRTVFAAAALTGLIQRYGIDAREYDAVALADAIAKDLINKMRGEEE